MRRKMLIILSAVVIALPSAFLTAQAGRDSDVWFGVYTQTIDPDLKEAFDLDSDYGVIIKMVVPDSPADKAGVKQGDIILRFDGKKVGTAEDLVDFVGAREPGDEVDVRVIRKGKEIVLTAELGRRDDYEKYDDDLKKYSAAVPRTLLKTYKFDRFSFADTYIGVSLENLNTQLGEYFGVRGGKGALIVEVTPESPAEKAGLKAGDVITKIDGKEIEELSDVRDAVSSSKKGDKLELTVLRDRQEREFTLEVEETPEDFGFLGRQTPDYIFDDDSLLVPRMKGLFRGNFEDRFLDREELEKSMEELKKEMKNLRRELDDLKKERE
jgi:serine protease Do